MPLNPIIFTHFVDADWPLAIAVFTCSLSIVSNFNHNFTAMGPDGALRSAQSDFTEKLPPLITGRESYRAYRNDVELRSSLASLTPEGRGRALLVPLKGEANKAASSVPNDKICGATGPEFVLAQLDKSCVVNNPFQLESGFTAF